MLAGHSQGTGGYNDSFLCYDGMSDNIASTHTRFKFKVSVRSGIHPVPTSAERGGYRGWNFLRACNFGLVHYDDGDVIDEIKNKYKAEARLFRGWFCAVKVMYFGDIPWTDKPLNIDSEELYASRMPREEAMSKVLEDLNFACEYLPDDWGDGNAPGRLNRWCALLVKSRVCLFEGTWRKYHGGSDPETWLQEAAAAAEELIKNGPYSLYSTGDTCHDYNALHQAKDLSGNPEVLNWRKYENGVSNNHAVNYSVNYVGGATKSFVEDFLCVDGLPITLSPLYKGDAQIEDVFKNRDPRLRQCILHPADQPYYYYYGSNQYTYPRLIGMSGGLRGLTGYHVIKHYEWVAATAAYNTSTTPAITLRLGEAMLNFAEAKAELGTITQEDLDISINELRDRVGMPHMDLNNIPVDPRYINDGVSPLIVEIRRERRIELFMEGPFRYDDLRRWKQGKKLEIKSLGMLWDNVAKARYPKATVKSFVDPVSGKTYIDPYLGTDYANPVFDETKHYLWPIQLDAIAQNPNIEQNPGYGEK
jgi:hypothetical protein